MITDETILDIFEEGGALSRTLPTYECRSGQVEMAKLVAHAYNEGGIVLVEAGTGIGKSFAYLAPAILSALEDPDCTTIIATSTIPLQQQLYMKDIPTLFRCLGKQCTVALVLGRGNYLCINRLTHYRDEVGLLINDPESDIAQFIHWTTLTESGVRSEYQGQMPAGLWGEVCSDGDICLGYKCPYIGQCFYHKSKKKALQARIVVTNHHMLFLDAKDRNDGDKPYTDDDFLPPFSHLVIDEAHNALENATKLFTDSYAGSDMLYQITHIEAKRGKTGENQIEIIGSYAEDKTLIDEMLDYLAEIRRLVGVFDQYLLSFMEKAKARQSLRIEVRHQQFLSQFETNAKLISAAASRFASRGAKLIENAKVPEELTYQVLSLSSRLTRINLMAETLERFTDYAHWGDDVHYFEYGKTGRDHHLEVSVNIAPLSVAKLLQATLYTNLDSIVCCSATLQLGDDFAFFKRSLGLENTHVETGVFESPFDYAHNLMLLTPEDALPFNKEEEALKGYLQYIADATITAISSSGGGALVLFTSYKMMAAVFDEVSRVLAKDYHIMMQGQNKDRSALLNTFKEETDSVLFATNTFWEGIDAPGDTLRLVIIAKLPFSTPDEPVFKARCEALEKQGKSPFAQLSLPMATMQLKQGYGRLLRSTVDKGVVIILDGRANIKYGPIMLRALPRSFHPECLIEQIGGKIEGFLY